MTNEPIQPSAVILYDPEKAIQEAKAKSQIVVKMRKEVLKKGVDYGVIPGTKTKPTLLKPGAERLCSAFGLLPKFEIVESIVDFDKPLFSYHYRCNLYHIETGKQIASGDGSCNSMESKYRYRWLWQNELNGIDTTGLKTRTTRNGKKKWRIDNDDIYTQVNTIIKMAQKRALIAAVLIATNASEHFTQDIEDFADDEIVVESTEVIEKELPVDTQLKTVTLYNITTEQQENGKFRYKVRTIRDENDRYETITLFERGVFKDKGYVTGYDWQEDGFNLVFDPKITCEIEKNKKGFWEFVVDTFPQFDPDFAAGAGDPFEGDMDDVDEDGNSSLEKPL